MTRVSDYALEDGCLVDGWGDLMDGVGSVARAQWDVRTKKMEAEGTVFEDAKSVVNVYVWVLVPEGGEKTKGKSAGGGHGTLDRRAWGFEVTSRKQLTGPA